jgi:hypothetical protein
MSRKLGVLVLAMGILAGAMGLKTLVGLNAKTTVIMANGVSPVPPPPKN